MSFAVPSPISLISCNHTVIMVLLILKKFYAEKTYIFFNSSPLLSNCRLLNDYVPICPSY